jgi:hypothetical protein
MDDKEGFEERAERPYRIVKRDIRSHALRGSKASKEDLDDYFLRGLYD